jgi:hypothetical protein
VRAAAASGCRDLAGEEATCETTATLRTDRADLEQRLDDAERTAHQLPHRVRYLMLVIVFMRQLLELHGELIDNVDRELASTQDASTASLRPLVSTRPRRRR